MVIWMAIVLNARKVEACSICVIAAMDKVLPPIYVWCLIAISWFLLNSLISTIYKVKISYTPSIAGALVLFILCILFGGAFLGPIPILALAIAPTITFLGSFAKTNKGNWRNNPYYSIQFIGFAAAVAITVTSYQTYQIYQNRTLAQYIVQWPSSGYSLSLFNQLKEKEPTSLADYRYILEQGRGFILVSVAERIAIIGDPDSDSKRLEQTIKRINTTSDASSITQSLEKSLLDLRLQAKQK